MTLFLCFIMSTEIHIFRSLKPGCSYGHGFDYIVFESNFTLLNHLEWTSNLCVDL